MIRLTVDKLLEEHNMTVQELAEKADIAYNTALALKRNASTRIDLVTIEKLCMVFNCQPGDLFTLE